MLWKKEHPNAIKAMDKLKQAIIKGLIHKPSKCALCGKKGRINGHHEDYDSPYKVCWVCSSCHKKIHLAGA